jgi:hypothetical protein
MRKVTTFIALSLVFLAFNTSSFGKLSKDERELCQTWKMWKVEENNSEVEPKFSRFMIDMKKNKTFSITSNYEIAFRGTWEFTRQTLIFHDQVTNKDIVLPVTELDHTHLVFQNFEALGRITFMTPVVHKDAIHLNHNEHLLAKKWNIYESSVDGLAGSMYDFHEDKTFDFILNGQTVPVSSGTWSLSADTKTITLIPKKGEQAILEVLEFHRHELVTKSQLTGTENKLHDAYLAERDDLAKSETDQVAEEAVAK